MDTTMQLEQARQQMIYHQIRPWDVSNERVLATLSSVPRERFVPEQFRKLAFADVAIPLDCGQSMLKPVIEGRLLQNLDVRQDDKVLVVGTGSGFVTACLAKLGGQVTSIDIHRQLIEAAAVRLTDAQIHNVDLQTEDFSNFRASGGFDRILVTGSMPLFDARLPEWLRPGGKLIMIVGKAPTMEVELITRDETSFTREKLFETVVQRLENVPVPETFRF
jgi:protein-L-isoaspartate(D-aspartate) O-methyltransferase